MAPYKAWIGGDVPAVGYRGGTTRITALHTVAAEPFIAVLDITTADTYSFQIFNGTVLVDWGDSTTSEHTSTGVAENVYHEYDTPGEYTFKMTPSESLIFTPRASILADFTKGLDRRFKELVSFGNVPIDIFLLFRDNEILTSIPSQLPSWVTSLRRWFYNSNYHANEVSDWDVSNVTEMLGTFQQATNLSGDITGWDVSNVSAMGSMFSNNTTFNQDISAWNPLSLAGTSLNGLFLNCSLFNRNIGHWDVSNCTNMANTFNGASNFNQPLNNWNTSNVTSMSAMFRASAFNQPIDTWDTSKVTTMQNMFYDATAFNQNIGGWDTGNVTIMSSMFRNAIVFNQNLSGWCVSQFATQPSNFANNTPAWTLPKPVWGTCPS